MEKTKSTNEQKELKISASEELKRGVYTNQALVSHTPEEFTIDFLFLSSNTGTLNSRVIMSPTHCKRLIKAMSENLSKYEDRYGSIEVDLDSKG